MADNVIAQIYDQLPDEISCYQRNEKIFFRDQMFLEPVIEVLMGFEDFKRELSIINKLGEELVNVLIEGGIIESNFTIIQNVNFSQVDILEKTIVMVRFKSAVNLLNQLGYTLKPRTKVAVVMPGIEGLGISIRKINSNAGVVFPHAKQSSTFHIPGAKDPGEVIKFFITGLESKIIQEFTQIQSQLPLATSSLAKMIVGSSFAQFNNYSNEEA